MQILIKDPKGNKAKEAAISYDQNSETGNQGVDRCRKFGSWCGWFTGWCLIVEMMLLMTSLIFIALHRQASFNNKIDREIQMIPQYALYTLRGPYDPDQVHLSLGSNSSELYVTWMTKEEPIITGLSYAIINQNGTDGPVLKSRADLTEYLITGERIWPHLCKPVRSLYTYRAKMSGLIPGRSYKYWIVYLYETKQSVYATEQKVYMRMEGQWVITIKDLKDPRQEINLAFYGDLGLINGQSVTRLTKDVSNGLYDLIIHNGDFAYDLDTKHGAYGDMFMRLIEPIASRVPYQTSVGNHELKQNFTHYDARFTMINSGGVDDGQMNNFYYSFNAGPVHFVGFSTEFYYFVKYSGLPALHAQYEWLKEDLAFASSPEQRRLRPWIVVFGHRPMYCSSRDNDDCTKETNILRKGFLGAYALEKLFYEFGVDVELYSHEHQYERFLPIYDGKVYNGTDDDLNPYYNPLAPVHLISGSAGCQERIDPFEGHSATGSIKQIADYGFTRIKATYCQLKFQQISDDKNGTVADEFVIIKTRQNFPSKSHELYDCDLGNPYLWPATRS